MKLERIVLKDFRNYEHCDLTIKNQIVVFFGDNAQGKTSLLEAIYVLSTGRSHRTSDERMCIRHQQELAMTKAWVQNPNEIQLKAVIHDKGKTLFYQNQPLTKVSEFIGKLNAIMFSPNDLELFDASPKERRRLIDVELGKIDPFYMERLSHYTKVLKERNAALKEFKVDETYLEVMTNQLIEDQCQLIPLKKAFIEKLSSHMEHIYPKLALEGLRVEMEYFGPLESYENLKEDLTQKYQKSLERDKSFKMTHVGIHRDDIALKMNSKNVVDIASQGQRRMVVIALKCALLDVVEEMCHERPILLLDDVFSELDAKRRQALFEVLEDRTQTFISTTDLDDIQVWLKDKVDIYEVNHGTLIERRSSHEH